MNWRGSRVALPAFGTAFFDEIRGAAADSAGDEPLFEQLAGLDEAERRALLASVVAEEAERILRLPAGGVDRQRPLAEQGMDSLMAVELRLAIEERLRLDLPPMSLADGNSVAALATRLASLPHRLSLANAAADLAARYEAPLDPFALGGTDLAAED